MNGAEIYQFVNSIVYPAVRKVFLKNKNTIKTIFLHQGSKLVNSFFKRKFKEYKVILPENISVRGNTVSATIPILLHDYLKNKKLDKSIMLCGFGVGLSYKIALVKTR